jgi:hypothetical protein
LPKATVTHRYGHCWRCKTPIIYLATEQWFLKVTEIKEKMLEEIDAVDWYPDWEVQPDSGPGLRVHATVYFQAALLGNSNSCMEMQKMRKA